MSGEHTGAFQHTVCIVEDEPVLREEMAFQLRHAGFEVVTFESASQFYRHLAVNRAMIAVLDIALADEDGLSICRHLREHDSRMGIVFVTARSLREQRLEGLQAGADAYLLKPVDMEELILVLRRLAERVTRSQALRSEGAWSSPETAQEMAQGPAWQLNTALSRVVAPNGSAKRISHSELLLLTVLARKGGEAGSHTELASALSLHPDEFDKHRIEVIVSRLKTSVQRETGSALPLRSVRGIGYALSGMRLVQELQSK